MEVNLNNLRKQTAYSLDRVIKILNAGILPEKEFATFLNDKTGKWKTYEGDVLINKYDLQRHIEELRSNVWLMLCVYDEKNPNFQTVFEEVENSGGLERFNNRGEDDV
jgi:hypothetical protein